MRSLVIRMLAIVLLGLTACSSPALSVNDGWSRPAAAGNNGAAYFAIRNGAVHANTLLGLTTDIAGQAEMHITMVDANNVMSMHPQATVDIPAGGTVEFKPGGLHVMLIGLKQDLKAGDTYTLTLQFRNAGDVPVTVMVRDQ